MIYLIYSIKDTKQGTFERGMFMTHEIQAIRETDQAVNDPRTTLNKYPQDYELWLIGQFEDNSGKITGQSPKFILSLMSLYKPEETNGQAQNGTLDLNSKRPIPNKSTA